MRAARRSSAAETKRAAHSGRHTARLRGASPLPRGRRRSTIDLSDVLCGGAFLTLHDVELHLVTLVQRLVAATLDGGVVHETILRATFGRDEAEALVIIEPLY